MKLYQGGANLYDQLMQQAPYEEWKRWTERVLLSEGKKSPLTVADIGCGTGTFLSMLLSLGHDAVGVDLSEQMLAVADEKIRRVNKVNPKLHAQDMVELSLDTTFDVITVFCDSLNYVLDEEEVKQSFRSFYEHLNEQGILLFDVHSMMKMHDQFPGFNYGDDDDHVSLIWNSYELEDLDNGIQHELTFFSKDDSGLYRRYEEVHVQRTFPLQVYERWLLNAGFKYVTITADFTDQTPTNETERVFFVARK